MDRYLQEPGVVPVNTGSIVDAFERTAAWLQNGRLDCSESLGNVATKLVIAVEDGRYTIPLQGGFDVVDEVDRKFIESCPPHVTVEIPAALGGEIVLPQLMVSHISTDGETRSAYLNLAGIHFEEAQ